MSNKDLVTKREKQQAIERSLEGLLVCRYRNMRNRVKGTQTSSPKYFIGREIMSFEAFLEWSLIDENYLRLHAEWIKAGYPENLSPSVDRHNSDIGYILGNIEWVTTDENRKRGREKFWKVKRK